MKIRSDVLKVCWFVSLLVVLVACQGAVVPAPADSGESSVQPAFTSTLDRVKSEGTVRAGIRFDNPPLSYIDFLESDRAANVALDVEWMRNGVNVIPGLRRFISSAHDEHDFSQTLDALDRACAAVKGDT